MRPLLFPTDQWLVQRALRGDKNSFGRLVVRHSTRVFHLIRQLTNDSDAAEDLTQETFIAAYSALDSWRGDSAFSSWLCGIAVRRYGSAYRRSSHEPQTDSFENGDDSKSFLPNDDPFSHYKRQEAEVALAEAIGSLSPACREVFVLVRIEDMPYQTVADLLNIPLGTVQSRLHRAVKYLHKRLSPLIYGGDTVPLPNTKTGAKHDSR